jgi:hypothetical protein
LGNSVPAVPAGTIGLLYHRSGGNARTLFGKGGPYKKGKFWVLLTVKKFEKTLATPFANEEIYIKMSTDQMIGTGRGMS